MAANDGPTHEAHRSSVTGMFVTQQFAESHPRTTFKETLPDSGPFEVVANDENEDEAAHAERAAESS